MVQIKSASHSRECRAHGYTAECICSLWNNPAEWSRGYEPPAAPAPARSSIPGPAIIGLTALAAFVGAVLGARQ